MTIPHHITGATVRRIRGRQTQAEFAADVGLASYVQVSRWEHDVRHPSRVFRRRLAELAAERGVTLNGRR